MLQKTAEMYEHDKKELQYEVWKPTGYCPGFVRVLENLEKDPGILLWHFPGLESPGKRPPVLESSVKLLNWTKKYEVYGRQ